MTKNPLHEAWNSELVTDHLYGLDELREALEESGDMPPASWKRTKRRNVVGLGRNCHLFETARTWAYREVRHHWGDSEGLRLAISAEAHEMNAELFPSHWHGRRSSRSPRASTSGSSPKAACGATAPPSTRRHSSPSKAPEGKSQARPDEKHSNYSRARR